MILSIWVFFILGDPAPAGTAYVQATAPAFVHDTEHARQALEEAMEERFHDCYPDVAICERGWCRQDVRVMGDD